jgi:hypothetical protein
MVTVKHWKHSIKGALVALILVGSLVASIQQSVRAVERATVRGSADAAIALAAAHPAFVNVLGGRAGWTAGAFDSGNSSGIWRVQFWAADGEEIGYADVSVTKGRVFSWESTIGVTDEQKAEVRDKLMNFIAKDPTVRELVGNPTNYEIWLDYNGWIDMWFVYIGKGGVESLYVGVNNNSPDPLDMRKLTMGPIYFPEIPKYKEWEDAQKAQAVSLAFAKPEVAAALRGHDGWQTETERTGDTTWRVTFKSTERVVAVATVDLGTGQVVELTITTL